MSDLVQGLLAPVDDRVRLQRSWEAKEKHSLRQASASGYGEEQIDPRHFEESIKKDLISRIVIYRGTCICYSSLKTTETGYQKTKSKNKQNTITIMKVYGQLREPKKRLKNHEDPKI